MFVRTVLSAGLIGLVAASGVVQAEPPPEPMTSLPDYLAMHRDDQLKLILQTQRAVALSFAADDYDRARCVARLFDATPQGDTQLYDLKGLLKASAEKRPKWKAEQVIEYDIRTFLCPSQPQS